MTRLDQIKEAAAEYDKRQQTLYKNVDAGDRIKQLIEQYGIEDVMAASGLKMSTLSQYMYKSNNLKAATRVLGKLEAVLSQF